MLNFWYILGNQNPEDITGFFGSSSGNGTIHHPQPKKDELEEGKSPQKEPYR
jgi:hypothetical protein